MMIMWSHWLILVGIESKYRILARESLQNVLNTYKCMKPFFEERLRAASLKLHVASLYFSLLRGASLSFRAASYAAFILTFVFVCFSSFFVLFLPTFYFFIIIWSFYDNFIKITFWVLSSELLRAWKLTKCWPNGRFFTSFRLVFILTYKNTYANNK